MKNYNTHPFLTTEVTETNLHRITEFVHVRTGKDGFPCSYLYTRFVFQTDKTKSWIHQ